MPKNVIITPATGLVEFKGASGNTDATIQLDDSGNLNLTSPNGDISIGDTTSDILIGDGVTSVDIIFEQSGAVRALTGKTLTIGQDDSTVRINSTLQITNTTLVANLNADLLDGLNSSSFSNTAYGNSSFGHANAAFIRANNSINANTGGTITGDVSITGNLTVTGLTTYTNTTTVLIADNIITVNAAINQAAQPAVNAGIEVDRGAQPNSSFLWIESSGKWAANNGNGSIFIAADSAETYANSAFATANGAIATNLTQNNSITAAFNTANSAFIAANSATATDTTQNNSITAAFIAANSAGVYANGAFAKANTQDTINLTQNNSITAAFLAANAATATDTTQNNSITAAFTRANNSLNSNTGGTVTANTTFSSNVFLTGNGTTLSVTSNISFISPNTQNTITARMVNGGTLSFSSNSGELFSITDSLAQGSIFSVNDISGLPIIDVDANGWISFAQFGGNVHVYNAAASISNSTGALVVDGGVGIRGNVYADAVYDGGIEIIQYANSIFTAANSAGVYANSAFAAANAASTTNLTQNNSITAAFNTANSAFVVANSATAIDTTQNNSITAAFNTANAAYTQANTDYTTISTTAGTYGNATYVPVITLAANGRVTLITNTEITGSGATLGDVLALAIALG